MNWLKEGYKEGQKMFLVSKYLYSEDICRTVTVVKVTTRSITVKYDDYQDTSLIFKKRSRNDNISFGCHYLYDSKEDYDNEIKQKKHYKDVLEFIKINLDSLSIDKLEEIKNKYFEEKCTGGNKS